MFVPDNVEFITGRRGATRVPDITDAQFKLGRYPLGVWVLRTAAFSDAFARRRD